MKFSFLALTILIGMFFVVEAESQGFVWRGTDGKPLPDTISMKTKDGFGGQLILTANEHIYDDWLKPEAPQIHEASKLPIGKLLLPVVLFVNPKKDEKGNIDVTYDLEVLKPDGSICQTISDVVCAKGEFNAPPFNLQLSESEVKWAAEEGDPLGVWKFKFILKDNIRGTQFPLEASIEIISNKDPNKK